MLKKLAFIILLVSSFTTFAQPCGYYLGRPYAVMGYYGSLVESSLLGVFTFSADMGEEKIYALDFEQELSPCNLLRRYLDPIVTTVSFANNFAYISDPGGPIYEWDPYLLFQWKNFPWNKYIVNTYGLGWGVSYDTRVSTWESHDSSNTKKLLNYLAFETTFALPCYPQLQLVLRIHHRSGAFGLYGADNAGSNFIGAGLRYYF